MRMKRHDWREQTDEGEKRLWRATKFGGRWQIYSRLHKIEEDYTEHPLDDLHALEQLREVLFNKYQRGRLPWGDILVMDELITEAGGTPPINEGVNEPDKK